MFTIRPSVLANEFLLKSLTNWIVDEEYNPKERCSRLTDKCRRNGSTALFVAGHRWDLYRYRWPGIPPPAVSLVGEKLTNRDDLVEGVVGAFMRLASIRHHRYPQARHHAGDQHAAGAPWSARGARDCSSEPDGDRPRRPARCLRFGLHARAAAGGAQLALDQRTDRCRRVKSFRRSIVTNLKRWRSNWRAGQCHRHVAHQLVPECSARTGNRPVASDAPSAGLRKARDANSHASGTSTSGRRRPPTRISPARSRSYVWRRCAPEKLPKCRHQTVRIMRRAALRAACVILEVDQ